MSVYACKKTCFVKSQKWNPGDATDDDEIGSKYPDFFVRCKSVKPERVQEEIDEIIPEMKELHQRNKKSIISRTDMSRNLPKFNDE